MTALLWDQTGEKTYETGVDHGVLYEPDEDGLYSTGVAWNGLTTVTESPSGAEANAQYADNIKYLNLRSAEEFKATIEALTYPTEFNKYDGLGEPVAGVTVGQQNRGLFGFCYRTIKGDDILGNDAGYVLHLVYGCSATPSEKAYATVNDSPEAISFSWEVDTVPVGVAAVNPLTGKQFKPTSIIKVDSTEVDAGQLASLEEILYGNVSDDPRLPTPDEVINLFAGSALSTGVSVAGGVDSVAITGTTTNYTFTVEQWDGDEYVVVGDHVNEAAAEALVLSNGIHRVTLHASGAHYIPVAQQTTFLVTVT